jgi:MFS family permease
VYRLTGSDLLLGVVSFCGQIPTLFLAPVAGVFVDRWDRHKVLLGTQVLSLLQSLALALLTFAGIITVWQVLALQVFQGVINAFDTPARQAFVVTMIEDRADLPNAIALNSSMVNASRIAGPAIGGVLIASMGEAWCFLVDAISYVAVIGSLLAMRLTRHERQPPVSRLLEELVTGFRYVRDLATTPSPPHTTPERPAQRDTYALRNAVNATASSDGGFARLLIWWKSRCTVGSVSCVTASFRCRAMGRPNEGDDGDTLARLNQRHLSVQQVDHGLLRTVDPALRKLLVDELLRRVIGRQGNERLPIQRGPRHRAAYWLPLLLGADQQERKSRLS